MRRTFTQTNQSNEIENQPANRRTRKQTRKLRVDLQKYQLHLILASKYQTNYRNQSFASLSEAAGSGYSHEFLAVSYGTTFAQLSKSCATGN
jgi:hypothetical protein